MCGEAKQLAKLGMGKPAGAILLCRECLQGPARHITSGPQPDRQVVGNGQGDVHAGKPIAGPARQEVRPKAALDALRLVGEALDRNAPHFAGAAVQAALRGAGTRTSQAVAREAGAKSETAVGRRPQKTATAPDLCPRPLLRSSA